MPAYPFPESSVLESLREGAVIPAHPLALTEHRRLDERRQLALTRYYHAAGAGGIAVGVHTTQFDIRSPQHGLFQPVLRLAARTAQERDAATGRRTILIAGICGPTDQAVAEALFARDTGYHLGLLSLSALREASDDTLIQHCWAVARAIPLMGFYLQPSVGGRVLSFEFWRRFCEIPNAVAIKVAPFNRYQTLDVLRAVAESGRAGSLALYTGNDDNIVADLLTKFAFEAGGTSLRLGFSGGLLGHWACWTRRAVELFERCRAARAEKIIPGELLTLAAQVTDANAALFDAAHQFAGCIAGIHEVLRGQGLMQNNLCLDPRETLSPGQTEEIARVHRAYPHLHDDDFVRAHLEEWLS